METATVEEIVEKVEVALATIRPFLHEDGGDISLIEVTEDMVAKVEFKGACTDCSMSNMTFKAGVREAILNNVSEIVEVEAVNLSS